MIVRKSTQDVNSNAGVFFVKQLLDGMGGFSRFDGWQKAARSAPCQRYSNGQVVKAQVALTALGTNGFQLANELRPGEQHSQKGFVPFFLRSIVHKAQMLTISETLAAKDPHFDEEDVKREDEDNVQLVLKIASYKNYMHIRR